MPIYTFECRGCGLIFEVRESVSDYAQGGHVCPRCGDWGTDRRLDKDVPIIAFKGDGWTK